MSLSGRARSFLKVAMADDAAATELADAIDAATSAAIGGNNTFTGDNTFNTGTLTLGNGATISDAKNVVLGTGTGSKIGTATGQKLAFHNATPVIQRAGADQAAVTATTGAAVATTAATSTTPFGYAEAQANAIVTNVNTLRVDLLAVNVLLTEIRAALVAKGLIKGAA